VHGPIFANIVLADEINRAPPRTQAALLEAMQEHRVTAAGPTMRLPEPFFVLATQNPIEQEGTYPLPEAQLDRFLFDIRVGYPDEARRWRFCARRRGGGGGARAGARCEETLALQHLTREFRRPRRCCGTRRARPGDAPGRSSGSPELVRAYVRWGAGPRAGQALILGAKAHALLGGRDGGGAGRHPAGGGIRCCAIACCPTSRRRRRGSRSSG
jgi:MoxR-like ATPase